MYTNEFQNQAAVLIAISPDSQGDEQLLLTKRSELLSLHRGEVAFPGGKWESQDRSLLDTALRESHEEVGLLPARVTIVDTLPVASTRGGILVTPFVGRIDSSEGLVANHGELDDLFWVPLEFLLEDKRTRTDLFRIGRAQYWAPVYHWQGFEIWGFTARVIVEFLNRVYRQKISRQNDAPEISYQK